MSLSETILDKFVSEIESLAIADFGTVKKKELPTAQENLDTLPLVTVAPFSREDDEPYHTEGQHEVVFPVQVVLIEDSDRTREYNDSVHDAREQIRQHFDAVDIVDTLGIAEVWDVRCTPRDRIDRDLLNQNYRYSDLVFRVHTIQVS